MWKSHTFYNYSTWVLLMHCKSDLWKISKAHNFDCSVLVLSIVKLLIAGCLYPVTLGASGYWFIWSIVRRVVWKGNILNTAFVKSSVQIFVSKPISIVLLCQNNHRYEIVSTLNPGFENQEPKGAKTRGLKIEKEIEILIGRNWGWFSKYLETTFCAFILVFNTGAVQISAEIGFKIH